VFEQTVAVSLGAASKSETLGHQEFILTYKTFDPVGPACLPSNAAPPHRVVAIEPH
jgi:altronate hydrolase